MSPAIYQFVSLDLPPLLTAVCASLSCALLGNFLVLRRLSLMGDAISHAVLPGIVGAFLVTGSRASIAVFVGAAVAGVVTAVLVELVRKFGRMDNGAAMGVVFSVMFAAGVLLMEQAAARNVDLDADCLLHGQLETIFWYPPSSGDWFSLSTFQAVPGEVLVSIMVFLLSAAFVKLFFKELAISAFDPALATSLGFNASVMHYLLMVFVAGAVVASFEAVGSILVIAMIICPAATARYFTDRLNVQIALSLVFAAVPGVGGYVLGAFGPQWLGFEHSVNAAGMMTVVAGGLLFSSAVFSPRYGVLSRELRRMKLAVQVYREDILAMLYRIDEGTVAYRDVSSDDALDAVGRNLLSKAALRQLRNDGHVSGTPDNLRLTEIGKQRAGGLLRSHRLWESFLVDKAGIDPGHVHESAERLEHFTEPELSERLAESQAHPVKDPHGKAIPENK